MNMRRLAVLDTLSVIGLIAAAIIALMPARVQLPNATPRAKTAMTLPTGADYRGLADEQLVLAANILSSSRHEPKVRYKSPDAEVMQAFAPAVVGLKPDSTVADSTGLTDVIPSLYGIVNNNGSWQALMRLSSSDVSPTLFKEGERRGAYRVVSIFSDRVIVAGSSGQRTLRLARTAPGDSTGSTGKRP